MPSRTAPPDAASDTIIKFAVDRTQAHWEVARQPYLISSLGTDLKSAGFDYRSLLGEVTLGSFFSSRATDVKVVRHPTLKAKVGLIPATENYEYPAEDILPGADQVGSLRAVERSAHTIDRRPRNARHVVMNFLEALGSLPEDDLQRVNIPVSVLAKLVAGR